MKTFESQMLSAIVHGAFIIFVVYFFVPPKVIDQGQGMLLELVSSPTPKGQKVKTPKVVKAAKEVMSKPVVIATRPKKKKVVKKLAPSKKPVAAVKKDVQQKALVTQKEKSIVEVPKVEKTAQNVKVIDSARDSLQKSTDQKAKSPDQSTLVSRSTGRKPAPPAAAPVVGEKKYSLAEAMGKEDGVKDARKLTQQAGNIPPTYPMSDRLENSQGKVVLVAYVNGAGQVEDIKVEDSTGSFLMEAASVRAFSKYRFTENQPGWVRMPFEFQLKGPAKEMHAQVDQSDEEAFEEAATNEEL